MQTMEEREKELIKLIILYQNLVFGKGSIIGVLDCLDEYYTDTFDEDVSFIEDVQDKLKLNNLKIKDIE
jgi:hypothetical protein